MLCELKKFKHYPRLSEETEAFNADLWIDGKFAAKCENSGKGGCNYLHFEDHKLEQAFHDYCKSLPPEPSEIGPLAMDGSFFISCLVDKCLQTKDDEKLKKQCKTKTLVILKSKPGQIAIYNCLFTPAVRTGIKKQFGDELEFVNDRFVV